MRPATWRAGGLGAALALLASAGLLAPVSSTTGWSDGAAANRMQAAMDRLWMEDPGARSVPPGASAAALGAVLSAARSDDARLAGAALAVLAEAHEAAENPLGVAQNASRAVSLYRLAASRGNPSAQFALASLHLVGALGVERSAPKAVTLLYFAAAAGLAEAQVALGWRHEQGRGVPKSCGSALAYMMPAAVQGARTAAVRREMEAADRFRLDDEALAAPAAARDAALSRAEFVRNRADAGDVAAVRSLATIRRSGLLGTRRDLPGAREALEAAAEADPSPVTLAELGTLLVSGVGAEGGQDADEAVAAGTAHLEAAAARDDDEAKATLALLQLRRAGVIPEPDAAAAVRLSERPGRLEPAALLSPRALSPPVPGTSLGEAAVTPASAGDAPPPRRLAVTVPAADVSAVRSALRLLDSAAEQGVPAAQHVAGVLAGRGVASSDGSTLVRRDLDKADTLFLASGQKLHHASLLARARTAASGLGVARSCPLALASLRHVTRSTTVMDELAVARARFERLDALGAAIAWTRAAAMGHETAAWNLALVLDRAVMADRAVLTDAWGAAPRADPASSPVGRALPAVDGVLRRLSRAVFGAVGSASAGLFGPSRDEDPPPGRSGAPAADPSLAAALDDVSPAPSAPAPLTTALLFPAAGRPRRLRDAEAACVALLDEAAASGRVPGALDRLAEFVRDGRGTAAGQADEAAELFRRAADQADPSAMWALAVMHETGRGLPRDWHLAKRLFDSAERAAAEARGPAAVGRASLWLRSRLARHLPAPALRDLSAALEPWTGSLLPPGAEESEAAAASPADPVARAEAASAAALRRSAEARGADSGVLSRLSDEAAAGLALVAAGVLCMLLAMCVRPAPRGPRGAA